MLVEVLYFAGLKERLGIEREELMLPSDPCPLDDVIRTLVDRHPEIGHSLSSLRFAINEAFQPGTALVRPGDVVALIPPVSGG